MARLLLLFFEMEFLLEREENQSQVQGPDYMKLTTKYIVNEGRKIASFIRWFICSSSGWLL